MKRIACLLAGLACLLCGCKEEKEPVDEPVSGKINISILNTSSTRTSITVTINALGHHLDDFDKWGVTMSETSDCTEGTDVAAPGRPSDGKKEVKIESLKENTSYYFWAWAEGKDVERQWTSSHTVVKTKQLDQPKKLSGTVIGSLYSVDYSTNQQSTSVNVKDNVFDGNYDTYFASYDRSGTWVGLDLGTKHVITKIGYSPRITQEHRVQLAVIEGANKPDFSDAIPIHMIKNSAPSRQMSYEDVNCSRGFRYVRYASPNNIFIASSPSKQMPTETMIET